MNEPLLLTVELHVDGSAISGLALDPSGRREHFGGWLELIALVQRAADRFPGATPAPEGPGGGPVPERSGVVSGVDPDDPARSAGHDGPDPPPQQPAHRQHHHHQHQGVQP